MIESCSSLTLKHCHFGTLPNIIDYLSEIITSKPLTSLLS